MNVQPYSHTFTKICIKERIIEAMAEEEGRCVYKTVRWAKRE
jgi:hypothetical protein